MATPNFSALLPDRTIKQIEALKPLYNGNKTQIVIDAIKRLYQQEIKTMNYQHTTVIRIEPVTYVNLSDKTVTRDFEVRQCIVCGKEFYTPVGSSDRDARSLYCGEHYAEYQKDFDRRIRNVDWDNQSNEMADGNPPQ